MYYNIDIDIERRKILCQYQYLTRILQYFSVSVSIFIFFVKHTLVLLEVFVKIEEQYFFKVLINKTVALVSSTSFPPLKSLSEWAEEASGVLNFIKILLINDSRDFKNGTVKYWKYQYISIYFLILSIDIDINEFSIKRYIIDICRIKRYFPIPKY